MEHKKNERQDINFQISEKYLLKFIEDNKEKIREILFDKRDKEEWKLWLQYFPKLFEKPEDIKGAEENMKKIVAWIKKLLLNQSELEKREKELRNKNNRLIYQKEELEQELVQGKNRVEELIKLQKYLDGEVEKLRGEISKLRGVKEDLNLELKKSFDLVENLQGKIVSYQQGEEEHNNTIHELEEEITEFKREKAELSNLYILKDYYDKYLSLPKHIKEKLENIIKYKDIESFLSCCYTTSTWNNLWDIVNTELRRTNPKECVQLGEVFSYFIEQPNLRYENDIYRSFVPKIGIEFDATRHIDVNGRGNGQIKSVIFPGYGTLETKKPNQEEQDRRIEKMNKLAIVEV